MSSLMSKAEPIKLGVLMDYIGESRTMDDTKNLAEPFDLVFRHGYESGMIDRPSVPVYPGPSTITAFGFMIDSTR